MKTVSTEQYEFSHGKKPRGEGDWAFATRQDVRAHGLGNLPGDAIVWKNRVLYSQAKAQLPAGDWVALP